MQIPSTIQLATKNHWWNVDSWSYKVWIGRTLIRDINPHISVRTYVEEFASSNALGILSKGFSPSRLWNVVVDGSDNFPTKYPPEDVPSRAEGVVLGVLPGTMRCVQVRSRMSWIIRSSMMTQLMTSLLQARERTFASQSLSFWCTGNEVNLVFQNLQTKKQPRNWLDSATQNSSARS